MVCWVRKYHTICSDVLLLDQVARFWFVAISKNEARKYRRGRSMWSKESLDIPSVFVTLLVCCTKLPDIIANASQNDPIPIPSMGDCWCDHWSIRVIYLPPTGDPSVLGLHLHCSNSLVELSDRHRHKSTSILALVKQKNQQLDRWIKDNQAGGGLLDVALCCSSAWRKII